MSVKHSILVAFLVAGMAGFASAEDIYVRSGATGKGSKANPYGTLWKAVDRAKRGDVIHVDAGTYNGKGGNGHFIPKVPNLTMVGGYNADFTERNPFKNLTILERAEDFRGNWTGLPEGIIQGDNQKDHSNLIVDGFVLNAKTRNGYHPTKINPKASYKGSLFKANSKNTKIRNCILLNNYGNGIYCTWSGEENEVSNNIIINNFYVSISTRSAQPDSVITIRNNTIAFNWFQPGKGGGMGIFVGKDGKTIMDSNVISFLQQESDDGIGVKNTYANDETVMKNNVFFSCTGGFYKYMDENRANLLVWKSGEFEELNDEDDCLDFMLDESGGNREADPGLKPNKDFATMFSNFMGSVPGKLNMDSMNKWRRMMGLPLQASKGSARENWALAYPVDQVVPNLISSIKGVGAQMEGPFESYKSASGAANKSYEQVEFAIFKKGSAQLLAGKNVQFKAGIGGPKSEWLIKKHAPRSDYSCYMLLAPGKKWPTRDYTFGYFLKGSEAEQNWIKYSKRKDRYNKKGGLFLKGTAYYAGKDLFSYPAGIIIDEVKRK